MAETTKSLQKQYDAALASFTAADTALKNAGLLNLGSAQKTFDAANKAFQAIKTRYDAALKREEQAATATTKSAQKQADEKKANQESLVRRAQIDLNSVNRRLSQEQKGAASPQKIAQLTSEKNSAQAVFDAIQNGATGKLVKVGGTSRVQIVLDQPVSATPTSASPAVSQGRATAQMRGEGMPQRVRRSPPRQSRRLRPKLDRSLHPRVTHVMPPPLATCEKLGKPPAPAPCNPFHATSDTLIG
jgi:hypothetical protein